MERFRGNVAGQCGMNAAVVAEYLWQLLADEVAGEEPFYRHDHYWCRASALTITGECPYLSLHMVKDAIKVLKKKFKMYIFIQILVNIALAIGLHIIRMVK